MKYFCSIITLFACFCRPVFAQDIVVTHSGNKLHVKVNYLTESSIAYTNPNDTTLNLLGKAQVEKIIYQSGLVEKITQKVLINGAEDWEKVVITNNPLTVIGLIKKGELESHLSLESDSSKKKGYDRKEAEKLKKGAAGKHAHIVLLKKVESWSQQKDYQGHNEMAIIYGY